MRKNKENIKAIKYDRLADSEGHFVGFKRTIVEYLPAGGDRWQFESFDHDEKQSSRLSKPPANITGLRRIKEKQTKKAGNHKEEQLPSPILNAAGC